MGKNLEIQKSFLLKIFVNMKISKKGRSHLLGEQMKAMLMFRTANANQTCKRWSWKFKSLGIFKETPKNEQKGSTF